MGVVVPRCVAGRKRPPSRPWRKWLNHRGFVQRGDFVLVVSGLGQDFIGVLAQARRHAVEAAAAMLEAETGAGEAKLAEGRVDLLQSLAELELRMIDDLLDPPDVGTWRACGVE